MPAICRWQNFRNVELFSTTRGVEVGVYQSSGGVRFFAWLGFIDRDDAKALQDLDGAIPVKLDAWRYSNLEANGPEWIELKPGEFVQGCLTCHGAYAVTTRQVRIVTGVERV